MAVFLVITSLTGAALAFRHEIDAWLNPDWFRVADVSGIGHDGQIRGSSTGSTFDNVADAAAGHTRSMSHLDAFTLRERVQAQLSDVRVDNVPLRFEPGHAVIFRLTPDGMPRGPSLPTQAFVDPYTGRVLGTRDENAVALDRRGLMPLIYRLHIALALPGHWGRLWLGLIALIWTLDCFVGMFLTLPSRSRRCASKPEFWRKWWPAWLIKRGAAWQRFNFDWHRASGLWMWLILLMYAWSSVMFNLRQPVYVPVMSTIFEFDHSWRAAAPLPSPLMSPGLDWRRAHQAAKQAMAELADERGLVVDAEESLILDRRRGLYAYLVHSDVDLRHDVGNTAILIDANTGVRRGIYLPTGGAAGDTFSNWLGALHMGHVFGWPYRVVVLIVGLLATALTITGILVWAYKRRARRYRVGRNPGSTS